MADRRGGWHLWIDATPRPGYANMSMDLALLERSEQHGELWLRLYQWRPSCLSFGRHEPATRRYNQSEIRRLGLDTVRRPTGGRAVWHAAELTYAVTAPTEWFGSPRIAYVEIHSVLVAALSRIGISGSLAAPRRAVGLGAGPCFASAAGGEVLVDGRKVAGSAQLCRGSGLLQHGSILLEHSQALIEGLNCAAGFSPLVSQPRVPHPLGRPVDPDELIDAVTEAARTCWRGPWIREDEPEPVLQAGQQHFPQFRSAEWTWTR
jgi:lipoate-protein ligase A